ncbi:MAG: hypothetical protein ACI8UD_000957 [Planctomycetota bacterium]|jgi:hypothetical protein
MTSKPDSPGIIVTGTLPNGTLALVATSNLVSAGREPGQVNVVHDRTPCHHEFLEERTNDAKDSIHEEPEFQVGEGKCPGNVTNDNANGPMLVGVFAMHPADIVELMILAPPSRHVPCRSRLRCE